MAWLYKRGDSKYWWLGWRTPDGKSHFKSTKCKEKADAQKQLAAADSLRSAKASGASLDAVYQSLSQRSTPRATVKAALAGWMTECESSTAPGTMARYRTVADAFATFLGAGDKGPMVDEVTPEQIRQFIHQRRAARSRSTLSLERKILSMFFIREIGEEHTATNPCAAVKLGRLSRAERRRKKAFTFAELQLVFSKCPDDFWRYLVLTGFYTGRRMGDLICLTWGSVDLNENVLRLTQAKTNTTVNIPMRPALRAVLAALRTKMGTVKPTEFVWPDQAESYQRSGSGGFGNQFYSILTECGLVPARSHRAKDKPGGPRQVSPISFHSLRHTFVTLLKATGGTQAVDKELAGHSSDAISDLYTHTDTAILAKAIAALPEVSA